MVSGQCVYIYSSRRQFVPALRELQCLRRIFSMDLLAGTQENDPAWIRPRLVIQECMKIRLKHIVIKPAKFGGLNVQRQHVSVLGLLEDQVEPFFRRNGLKFLRTQTKVLAKLSS